MHPVVSVKDTGPIIASGVWITVEGEPRGDDFKNEVTTLMGDTIDLEHYGMTEILWFNAFWFVMGFAWLGFWFIRKDPVLLPRYAFLAAEGGEENAGSLISIKDMVVSGLFFGVTLVAIVIGYLWGNANYPNTTPLQTGKVVTNELEPQADVVDVVVSNAVYHIPGRAFNFDLTITNKGDSPLRVGDFATAGVRFVNAEVLTVTPIDRTDPVSPAGLIVTGGAVQPGETRTVRVSANDALWEKYRLTSLIYDPDSRFGGMIFLYDDEGNRYYHEVGGVMIPDFLSKD
ncbi:MAG: hypothetical protein JKY01_06545 [Pseudomonadales bacterium]|nr:hypothetical protein [Pseudomonadales bacterium]